MLIGTAHSTQIRNKKVRMFKITKNLILNPTILQPQIHPYRPIPKIRVPIRNTADYSPFGVQLDGRTVSMDSYRFGFNGQEKVDEISGSGNHNTALFWEYDTRLGRRWNRDPKPNPSLSDYATFANNPIWFNDPLGDIFKIGTKDSKAKDDVKDLTKSKNQKYLKFQDDGEVKTDFSGLSQKKIDRILKKDEGLSLINSLSTAKDGEGKDLNFFYGTEGSTGIGLENPQMQMRFRWML